MENQHQRSWRQSLNSTDNTVEWITNSRFKVRWKNQLCVIIPCTIPVISLQLPQQMMKTSMFTNKTLKRVCQKGSTLTPHILKPLNDTILTIKHWITIRQILKVSNIWEILKQGISQRVFMVFIQPHTVKACNKRGYFRWGLHSFVESYSAMPLNKYPRNKSTVATYGGLITLDPDEKMRRGWRTSM